MGELGEEGSSHRAHDQSSIPREPLGNGVALSQLRVRELRPGAWTPSRLGCGRGRGGLCALQGEGPGTCCGFQWEKPWLGLGLQPLRSIVFAIKVGGFSVVIFFSCAQTFRSY